MFREFYVFVASWLTVCLGVAASARQFDLVVYNVENLFDVDGVAMFSDYNLENQEMPSPYSPAKLLTKIQNAAKVLKGFNDGAGPDVILFQELELDRTPETTVSDYATFLQAYAGTTVDAMLTTDFNETVAGLPVDALLLKYFADNGMAGYHVALPEPFQPFGESPAHTNAVFTRFPVTYEKSHPTPSARMIQEVGLDIDGSELIVFNNHWKSGASNPSTEAKRVRNAYDLRAAVMNALAEKPNADLVIAGDLNTYYNAKHHFLREKSERWEGVSEFAIEVLGSQGSEAATRRGERLLYNLWFELPEERRGSELYRGSWGTLMQILITPGLYDGEGVHYVDNSFRVLAVPGLNASGPWNAPISWHFTSDSGGGFSDHFPIVATFTTGPAPDYGWSSHDRSFGPTSVPSVDYDLVSSTALEAFTALPDHTPETLSANMGEVFVVEGELIYTDPFVLRVGENNFQIYSYDDDVRDRLYRKTANRPMRFIGQLDEFRGKPQFIIHDENWLR